MAENEEKDKRDVGQDNPQDTQVDYIEALKQLKATTVSKEEYDKVKAENKRLINDVINGSNDVPKEQPAKPDITQLRKELFDRDGSLNNLEYVSKALQLRKAIMDEGGEDVFLPVGKKISPTEEDIAAAARLADGLQHCVDYADGDSELFTNELQRITIDTAPMATRPRRNNNMRGY